MKRTAVLLLGLCLIVCVLAACGSEPETIRLEPLDPAATPPLTQSARSVRITTPFGPAVTAALPSPDPTDPPVSRALSDAEKAESQYVLNTSSKRFHLPDCPSVGDMKASNRQDFFGTREDLLAQGYKPCGRCNP